MKRLFILVVLIAAGVAALGYHQGWFSVSTDKTLDGKTNVTVTVDKDKMHADKEKMKEKVADIKHDAKDKASEVIEKTR